MTLLTLHTDRLDRLTPSRVNDGYRLVGHWLLQKAVDAEVITWDKAVWGHLDFGVEPADRDDLRPRELVISYMVSKDGPTITGGIFADLPDNWNELTTEEEADVPASFPDPTQRPGEFLVLVVDELNQLHASMERLVAAWPGNTGTPLI
ncbi:hypothetical protein L1080_037945 [Rhodococcus sp. MSC1_016]|jgi:hypothetical protein|uniref:hypothetical protein n=1 Tax=Rhodococcus sp. MSC1_016 TaxID=2909266 RepID=UPI00202DC962|nr:hypothetical protein [Rhodococcus sp. MSC1_016]